MVDWTSSMQQTYEYYIVDPGTWKESKLIDTVKSCTVSRDLQTDTLGSATIDIADSLGECYIRAYLVTIQNGVKEKHPLGTFLIQTPSSSFDGKSKSVSMDAYTPLIELKEKIPPIGYSLKKGDEIMETASRLAREGLRAPVIETSSSDTIPYDFVANTNDTWLSFIRDFIANAKYSLALDEYGRILFMPNQDTASLQPIWTFDDSNSSILYSDFTLDHDLYDVPNVVEVLYSDGEHSYYARIVNDDPNSPVSTVNRGREIIQRVTDPQVSGTPNQEQITLYARNLLRELSSLEYTISYAHGYCPVRIGDCVRFNYSKAGLMGVKAKVISQSIKCEPGCPVTEKAVFTTKLWG